MTEQGQFGVDEDALRGAIKKLEGARDRARSLSRNADLVEPGELTALDRNTWQARQLFKDRMSGPEGSLKSSTDTIYKKLQEKIDAYYAALGEYARAEDSATVDAKQVEGQA